MIDLWIIHMVNMSNLPYLKARASECFKGLKSVLETLNRDYPKADTRWEIDEDKMVVRRVKIPSFEWEKFDEPNDPIFDGEDQERILRR